MLASPAIESNCANCFPPGSLRGARHQATIGNRSPLAANPFHFLRELPLAAPPRRSAPVCRSSRGRSRTVAQTSREYSSFVRTLGPPPLLGPSFSACRCPAAANRLQLTWSLDRDSTPPYHGKTHDQDPQWYGR